jgi:hypothetical protein
MVSKNQAYFSTGCASGRLDIKGDRNDKMGAIPLLLKP